MPGSGCPVLASRTTPSIARLGDARCSKLAVDSKTSVHFHGRRRARAGHDDGRLRFDCGALDQGQDQAIGADPLQEDPAFVARSRGAQSAAARFVHVCRAVADSRRRIGQVVPGHPEVVELPCCGQSAKKAPEVVLFGRFTARTQNGARATGRPWRSRILPLASAATPEGSPPATAAGRPLVSTSSLLRGPHSSAWRPQGCLRSGSTAPAAIAMTPASESRPLAGASALDRAGHTDAGVPASCADRSEPQTRTAIAAPFIL